MAKADKQEIKTIIDALINKETNTGVHSEIDNQLLSNTINRILHADDWAGTKALYDARTRGGEKRFIEYDEPAFSNMGTKENLEFMDSVLRMVVERNPNFSDTLRTEDVPDVIGEMEYMESPGIIEKILNFIRGNKSTGGGGGGPVEKRIDVY